MMKQRRKRCLAVGLAAAALLCGGITGCGTYAEEETVTEAIVQSVSMLLDIDLTGSDTYAGVVEARTTQKVSRDNNRTIGECLVSAGDLVEAGDVLFTYDMDAVSLTIESLQLEIDQLKYNIESYDTQIAQLEKEKKAASSGEQLAYTIQIQTVETDQATAEYNLKQKQAELEKMQASLDVTEICAEISGVVQSVDEDSSDAYIIIQEVDAFCVKGTATELNVDSLYEGESVVIRSRVSDASWTGTITEVNVDAAVEEDTYYSYTGSESASKYNFYVELDSSDDLLMGQHVYITTGDGTESDGIWLSSAWVSYDGDGNPFLWTADSNGKLERRTVELGEYDEESDTWEILSGLTAEDYIAAPNDELTVGMTVTYIIADSFDAEDTADDSDTEDEMSVDTEEASDGDTSYSASGEGTVVKIE